MKKENNPSRTPSPREIFFFDCGRSYQAGLTLSLMKIKKLSLQEFTTSCYLILVRYLDVKREDAVQELYEAFKEGFEKGETAKNEGLKMVPWGIA